MADVTSYPSPGGIGIDVYNPSFLDLSGGSESASATSYSRDFGGRQGTTYFGVDITFNQVSPGVVQITGGTITGVDYLLGGALFARATGLSVSAVTVAGYNQVNDGAGLITLLNTTTAKLDTNQFDFGP